MKAYDRRSFLKAAGVAGGAAAISVSPAAAAALEPAGVETAPSGPIPGEPIVAIIRDEGRGEVTVLSGQTEKTYKDRILVKRLRKAATFNHRHSSGPGGVA